MDLGEELGNISEACRKLGISRQHHYDIKQAIEEEDLEGLMEEGRREPRKGKDRLDRRRSLKRQGAALV